MSQKITDPVEKVVSLGLIKAGIKFQHESEQNSNAYLQSLDFFLPEYGIYLECKRFHTDRISDQMSRSDNVIAIQGMGAAEFFANAIGANR